MEAELVEALSKDGTTTWFDRLTIRL